MPGASLVAQMINNLPTNLETWVQYLGWEDSPGEGNGNSLQYSCLGHPMDRGAWQATSHGVGKESHMIEQVRVNKCDHAVFILLILSYLFLLELCTLQFIAAFSQDEEATYVSTGRQVDKDVVYTHTLTNIA